MHNITVVLLFLYFKHLLEKMLIHLFYFIKIKNKQNKKIFESFNLIFKCKNIILCIVVSMFIF